MIAVANLDGDRRIGIGPEHHADIDVLSGERNAVGQRQGGVRSPGHGCRQETSPVGDLVGGLVDCLARRP